MKDRAKESTFFIIALVIAYFTTTGFVLAGEIEPYMEQEPDRIIEKCYTWKDRSETVSVVTKYTIKSKQCELSNVDVRGGLGTCDDELNEPETEPDVPPFSKKPIENWIAGGSLTNENIVEWHFFNTLKPERCPRYIWIYFNGDWHKFCY